MTVAKFFLSFCCLSVTYISAAQSKKELIETLQTKLDSTQKISTEYIKDIEKKIFQLDSLEKRYEIETEKNTNLSTENITLQAELNALDSVTQKSKLNIIRLEEEVIKKDSAIDNLSICNKELQLKTEKLNQELFDLKNKYDSLTVALDDINLKDQELGQIPNWLTDTEIEMIVQLSEIISGDMSTYLTFKTKNNLNISFAYWSWICSNPNIDSFMDSNIGTYYKVKIKNSLVKELEYKGLDIGNIETGRLIYQWILVDITPAF